MYLLIDETSVIVIKSSTDGSGLNSKVCSMERNLTNEAIKSSSRIDSELSKSN